MRGLEVVLSSALPIAELPRGTQICLLKNSGSFKMSSVGMALTWCKRWGCKALKAVTYPLSLAGNCIQPMLTVLKRMVAPYAKARVCGALEQACYEALLLTQQLQSNQVKQQCCKRSLM